jgi:hypothetical protein
MENLWAMLHFPYLPARGMVNERGGGARFGTKKPPARKSAASLVEGNEFYPLVWDYWTLCEAHELRNGVWSLETAFGKQPS